MRRSLSLALATTAVAALAVGCGNDSSKTKTTAHPDVRGAYPVHGIHFTPPTGWNVERGKGALVATIQAGQSKIVMWRYRRDDRLPKTTGELDAAGEALISAARKRDRSFAGINAEATTVAGQPAVQIRSREIIAGQKRSVRSTHIYADGAEIVIDAYSDADSFRKVDADVFRPLLRSLKLGQPRSA